MGQDGAKPRSQRNATRPSHVNRCGITQKTAEEPVLLSQGRQQCVSEDAMYLRINAEDATTLSTHEEAWP